MQVPKCLASQHVAGARADAADRAVELAAPAIVIIQNDSGLPKDLPATLR